MNKFLNFFLENKKVYQDDEEEILLINDEVQLIENNNKKEDKEYNIEYNIEYYKKNNEDITDFNDFFNKLIHVNKNDFNYRSALITCLHYEHADAIYFNSYEIIDLNNLDLKNQTPYKNMKKNDGSLACIYLKNVFQECDIATNIYTSNENISIYVYGYGKLTKINASDKINNFLVRMHELHIVIKFENDIIPDKIKLYYTGIVLNTVPRKKFIKFIENNIKQKPNELVVFD